MVDKHQLVAELIQLIEADLAALTESQNEVQSGATHEEARPESDKDTRATESSYLARGLAKRVVQLQGELSRLRSLAIRGFASDAAVAMGALVSLEDEDGELRKILIVPGGGGRRLAAGEVVTVTPSAPLCRALLGSASGDEITTSRRGQKQVLAIADVR
jgi:transcription elongation GreA/GreB family factor